MRPSATMWAAAACALATLCSAQAAGTTQPPKARTPAAAPAPTPLQAQIQALLERMERLERDNRELREALARSTAARAAPAAAPAAGSALEQRVTALEQDRQAHEQALATERLSEREPELVTRLKAVETQAQQMQVPVKRIEALDGIEVAGSLTAAVQSVNRAGAAPAAEGEAARRHARANYRGDVTVSLPAGAAGAVEGRLFAHLRLGQGQGVAMRPTYTSTGNTTLFEPAAGSDDSYAIVAQAWYQLDIPLPLGGHKPHSRERLELTVGKIDPFLFFDQNAAADDETTRFLNNAFVHNPLLDSGGDTGADAYGFAPGVRAAYVAQGAGDSSWGASLGVFGAGAGAGFSGSLGQPFVIAQIDTAQRLAAGLPGNYRLYAWHNGQGTDADGRRTTHRGWGVSVDQRLGDDWTLFARAGHQTSGLPAFARAYTLGGELTGNAWQRGADGLGLAVGWLRGRAQGSAATERIAELYYRMQLNDAVQLTPDLQWMQHPAGDRSAGTVRLLGLRAKVSF